MSQFNQLYMSTKAIHILLSLISVLSFVLVSYSTVFLPLLSTFSMKLFSYSTDRNYIFLLFNGILVFLIKNSSLVTNSSLDTDHTKNNHVYKIFSANSSSVVDHIKTNQIKKTLIGISSPVSYHIKNNIVEKTREINPQVPESSPVNPEVLTQQGEEETDRKQNKIMFLIADSESDGQTGQVIDIQEDGNEYYVDEEDEERSDLNKRCEEFIRRMKQDIKTEATRRLTRIS